MTDGPNAATKPTASVRLKAFGFQRALTVPVDGEHSLGCFEPTAVPELTKIVKMCEPAAIYLCLQ